MTIFHRGVWLAIGVWALGAVTSAAAQENLDLGKNGAQLFAANCAICHKSPQGLGKAGGISGLQGFLREHYTASAQTAAIVADYLNSVERGPAQSQRGAVKRSAKGEERGKPSETPGEKPGVTPGDAKGSPTKPGKPKVSKPHSDAPKSDEPKSDVTKSGEAKSGEAKSGKAKSDEAKPDKLKSEKPDLEKSNPETKPEKPKSGESDEAKPNGKPDGGA